MDWNFEWDLNHDENWRQYTAYANQNGRGGTVGNLHKDDVVRIREKSKDGWKATTNTEVTLTMNKNEIKIAVFGNQRTTKPTPTPVPTPPELPKTGADAVAGLMTAFGFGSLSLGLKVLSRRLRQ